MITLTHFPRAFGVPNPSPFCMKVEILLKMAGLPYDEVITSDPRKGPKGKLPAITDDGVTIGDSDLIQHHLARKYGVDFDAGLSVQERAIAHAFSRMGEERLYWCLVYSRWLEDRNFPKVRTFFFGGLPPVVRTIVPMIARRQVRASFNGQGLGRHSQDEIYAFGKRDIDAIAAQLADKPFLMGNALSSADAAIVPILTGLLIPEMRSPLMDAVEAHPELIAYVARCRALWFGAVPAH
jgi:glutathione S-transferase